MAKIQFNVINYSTRIILFMAFFDERNLYYNYNIID